MRSGAHDGLGRQEGDGALAEKQTKSELRYFVWLGINLSVNRPWGELETDAQQNDYPRGYAQAKKTSKICTMTV